MKPLFFVGYMGCGKSTLARKVARRLGIACVDTDALVEQTEGASVADIFHFEGEERFRIVEREVLDTLIDRGEAVVVSTGGGLPLWRDNMERMNRAGTTIFLRRSAVCIARRLSPYGIYKRPRLRGLEGAELVAFMARDIAAREPFYARAGITIDCDALSDEAAVEKILNNVKIEK